MSVALDQSRGEWTLHVGNTDRIELTDLPLLRDPPHQASESADGLGDTGEVVGVDVSAEMLRVARANADTAKCRVRFTVGDACALNEPNGCLDAVRSERTSQWIAQPLAAVGEMARVVRPGGRVSLIDTDWSTLAIDVGDNDLASRVRRAMRVEPNRPSNLHDPVQTAGLTPLARTAQTLTGG